MNNPPFFAKASESARAQCERRLAEEGARAAPGTSNPYLPGSAAATWWQRGRDAARAEVMA